MNLGLLNQVRCISNLQQLIKTDSRQLVSEWSSLSIELLLKVIQQRLKIYILFPEGYLKR